MTSSEKFKMIFNILDKNELGFSSLYIKLFEKLKDEELLDENKVAGIIEKIKTYEDRVENNPNRYPEQIMQTLRQRNGLDKLDISIDHELNKISPDQAFEEVVRWNGLLGGYETTIKGWVKDIYGVTIGE